MKKEEKNYLLGLNTFPKFGPVRLKRIGKYFPSWKDAFNANISELKKAGIEEKIAEEYISTRNKIDINKLLEELNKENIKTVTLDDDDYPSLLREIYNPPLILYYKGHINFNKNYKLAVVGSRKCTYYGKQIINSIIPMLARSEITIVSGLALGIDSIAQEKTIAENGSTLAVIGSGVDKASIYPKNNLLLSERIISAGGGIISEFPPQTPPLRQNFPQRNRIIAGISHGTLVIEAALKSGSLITSRYALEQGRDVFAVPGNIYSSVSVGPNNLIKAGAKVCTTANDILEAFDIDINNKVLPENIELNLSINEKELLPYITKEPIYVNELVLKTKLDISSVNSTLSLLEIKGIIKNIGNSKYIK